MRYTPTTYIPFHFSSHRQRLFGFFVHCVLFAESAVLLCLHSLRMVLFLFCHVVITLFAFSTCQCDFLRARLPPPLCICVIACDPCGSAAVSSFLPCFCCSYFSNFRHKKRPSSMSLVFCSTGTACYQQISPKYAEIFYQNRIVHRCPANCNIRSPHGEFLFEAVPDRKWFCAQFFLRTEPFCVLP